MPKRPAKSKPSKTAGRLQGDRIRALREARGWTQMELAHRVESFPPVISLIEAGKREITTAFLARICVALEVSSDFLLGLSDDPSRK